MNHLSDDLLLRKLHDEIGESDALILLEHLQECAECRDRFAALRRVTDALCAYSSSLPEPSAMARQREALLVSLEKEAVPAVKHPRRPVITRAAWALAAAAVIAITVVGVRRQMHRVTEAPVDSEAAAQQMPPSANDFIPLPYSDRDLPLDGAVVLQVEVPREAAALAGISGYAYGDKDRIPAEVLVGVDGMARAIRFVH